jgi:DNA-binding transcriptional ArsR family regulator
MAIEETRPDVVEWIKETGCEMPPDIAEETLRHVLKLEGGDLIEAVDLVYNLASSRNGSQKNDPTLRIVRFDEFVAAKSEPVAALAGDPSGSILPHAGLVIVGGVGGSSKTTFTIDAVAHLASATPWLGYAVADPVRVLLIENEGAREQYRQKLEEKAAAWQGRSFTENVHVLDEEKWGGASFADPGFRSNLTAACEELEIALVVANPIGRLGAIGGGTPEEVGRFIEWLRECGLWRDRAFLLIHHFNRGVHRDVLMRLSGAWDRDADTIIGLALDGTRRTELTWAKLRWATPPERKTLSLEWEIESRGFRPVETGTHDVGDENRARVLEQVRAGVDTASAISALVGLSKKTVVEHLKALEKHGLVKLNVGLNRQLHAVAIEVADVPFDLDQTEDGGNTADLEWR